MYGRASLCNKIKINHQHREEYGHPFHISTICNEFAMETIFSVSQRWNFRMPNLWYGSAQWIQIAHSDDHSFGHLFVRTREKKTKKKRSESHTIFNKQEINKLATNADSRLQIITHTHTQRIISPSPSSSASPFVSECCSASDVCDACAREHYAFVFKFLNWINGFKCSAIGLIYLYLLVMIE